MIYMKSVCRHLNLYQYSIHLNSLYCITVVATLIYRIGGYFHGKLYSRFAVYLSQGSYFRGRKFRVDTRSCPGDVSLR